MRSWIRTLVLLAGLLTAQRVSASALGITAPPTLSTTAGLGFSVAAVLWAETDDSLRVTVAGQPEGLSYRFLRLRPGYGVATLSGVIPPAKTARDYPLSWTVAGPTGKILATAQTALSVLPPAHAGGTMAAKVRDLLCRYYRYGIDAQEVRNLGPGALPYVFAILRDTTCERSWTVAAAAAGALGLPTVYDSLDAFLWKRFSGDVGAVNFDLSGALFYTPVAMGMAASSRADVVDSLIAATDPNHWLRLPWHYGSHFGRDLAIAMTGRAIMGLSLVADGRAVAALERLSTNPYDPLQLDYVRTAVETQRKVLDRGWQAVREEERLENQQQ